jgi:tRNA (cytidine/uridine-2'-O-)-methyltransferase
MINVVLYRPEKPQNTGNIMRTCVAIHAVLHIIGPLTFSIDSKDLKRVGMDYIDDLKMFFYPTYEDFIKKYKNQEIYYVTRYSQKVYSSFDFTDQVKDIFVMFGRESTGIPYKVLHEHLDHCFRIPTTDKIRSLNLSNCVAMVLFYTMSQLNYPDLIRHEPDTFKGENFIDNYKEE